MKKPEFSKVLVTLTLTAFFGTIIEMPLLAYFGVPDAFTNQQIVSVAGVLAIVSGFYLNKSKLENSIKIKKDLIQWEYEFKQKNKLNEQETQELANQIDNVENVIDNKVDSEIANAINEDIQ